MVYPAEVAWLGMDSDGDRVSKVDMRLTTLFAVNYEGVTFRADITHYYKS